MRSVKEIYDYSNNNDYGKSINDKVTYNQFAYCARQLEKDEEVLMSFVGILYYQPSAQFTQWYGVLITQKRIIVGLAGFFNKEYKIFNRSDYHSLLLDELGQYHTISFIGDENKLNIGVLKHRSLDIYHDILSKTSYIALSE